MTATRGEAVRSSPLAGARIVFLFGSFDLGGAERQGLLLADYLRTRLGADVTVCALNPRAGRLSELCDDLGIPWQGIPFHWGLSKRWYFFPKALAALKKERPDILVSYTCVPNLVCALGRTLVGATLSVWNQADEGLLLNPWPLHRFAVRQSRCIISNSSGGKNFLLDTYGIPAPNVHLIYNGIALPAAGKGRHAWREELGLAPDTLVACMVANLSRYKDHGTVIRAWREVAASRPDSPPVLLLAGRFDGTERQLQDLAAELHCAAAIRFLGPVADVSGLLSAADLFVYGSKSEGIPNAVLEAMAAGLPVVGSDIPGIREAVGPEGADLLVSVGDHGGMAARISLLLQDAGLRIRYGSLMKRRVETVFGLSRMCEETAEVIAEALTAANRRG
jgi:glycosyltransferase involved in cell wall biosynthesis